MTSLIKRTLTPALFLGAVIALLAGLGGAALAGGRACETGSDCDPGETCEQHTCVPLATDCLGENDCPSGQLCYFGDCVNSCSDDSQCAEAEKCQDAACIPLDDVSGTGRHTATGCQLVQSRPDAASLLGALVLLGLLLATRRSRPYSARR